MKKVVAEYDGIKYSLQPYGLKSRFLAARSKILVSLGVAMLAFGAVLLAATPAGAVDPNQVFVTVCGNSTDWYVNSDEWDSTDGDGQGDRRPYPSADGLVFSPTDLIHHATDLLVSDLLSGSYLAAPTPDQPSFFSVEVINPSGAYGTLRWDGTNWWITISSGGGATAGTFSDASPVSLLAGKVTKWGAFSPVGDRVISFGVGYTNQPPGTVTTVVSSINFMGADYGLTCAPTPSPTPSPSPTPAVTTTVAPVVVTTTIVKPTTTKPKPTTTSPLGLFFPSLFPTQTVPITPTPDPTVSSDAGSDASLPEGNTTDTGGNPLIGVGFGVAAVSGAVLVALGVLGIVRRKQYQGSHHAGDDTEIIPTVDEETAAYDPDFYSEETDVGDTVEVPPVSEEPPSELGH